MTKKQEETLSILKELVEKQKLSIAKKDDEIIKLTTFESTQLKEAEEKIEILEGRLLDEGSVEKINCGIGVIRYTISNGNLQLTLIMENLSECLQKQGNNFMLEALQILSQ